MIELYEKSKAEFYSLVLLVYLGLQDHLNNMISDHRKSLASWQMQW